MLQEPGIRWGQFRAIHGFESCRELRDGMIAALLPRRPVAAVDLGDEARVDRFDCAVGIEEIRENLFGFEDRALVRNGCSRKKR